MKQFIISPIIRELQAAVQHKIDFKTKPPGSLGQLESVALQVALIQNTPSPVLMRPQMLVFAGDHGIVEEGVSAYPQDVTWQMVLNFLRGGAAINVFCAQHSISLAVVDAGVKYDFDQDNSALINAKVGRGTRNFSREPAMSLLEVDQCFMHGASIVDAIGKQGCNVVGFGEMGIGNTASASAIMSALFKIPIGDCVGRGTGLNDAALHHKLSVLDSALKKHGELTTPLDILTTFGGYEIAQMAGGMLQAASLGMMVLVDGFIATAAYAVAHAMYPALKEYCIFCHQSHEQGHRLLLDAVGAKPLLDLGMRLGEGTGCAVAYPLVASAVMFLNTMASFESASVSNKH